MATPKSTQALCAEGRANGRRVLAAIGITCNMAHHRIGSDTVEAGLVTTSALPSTFARDFLEENHVMAKVQVTEEAVPPQSLERMFNPFAEGDSGKDLRTGWSSFAIQFPTFQLLGIFPGLTSNGRILCFRNGNAYVGIPSPTATARARVPPTPAPADAGVGVCRATWRTLSICSQ
eukprot:gene13496-biopygen4842